MIRTALLGLLFLAACESPAPEIPTATPDGPALYAGTGLCYACHGDDGTGTPRGPDLTDADWLHFASRPSPDSLIALIAHGVDQPVAYDLLMPPAALQSDELQAVATYVLALSEAE